MTWVTYYSALKRMATHKKRHIVNKNEVIFPPFMCLLRNNIEKISGKSATIFLIIDMYWTHSPNSIATWCELLMQYIVNCNYLKNTAHSKRLTEAISVILLLSKGYTKPLPLKKSIVTGIKWLSKVLLLCCAGIILHQPII